ncbi:MAG: leucyl aminopeptidase [Cellulosilyticaceae bacterium]
MTIDVNNQVVETLKGTITLVYEDRDVGCETITKLRDEKMFEGKSGEVFYYTTADFKYRILVGLGAYDKLERNELVAAIAKGAKQAAQLKLGQYGIYFMEAKGLCTGGVTRCIVEGLTVAHYKFDKYKSDALNETQEITILGAPAGKEEKMKQKIVETIHVMDGVLLARDLVNEPANMLYPDTLAERVEIIGKESGFGVEVFEEDEIEAIGMEAFLEVARGSDHRPRLIVMRYMGNPGSEKKFGLVGKGLTFDTGGYSLKPSASMENMKSDMGGAAAVIGTMQALARNKVKENVIAVVAACENAISGGSYKPGDIIGSMAGKSIEILNTDAEGRLTLVDAITYIIEREGVDQIIDVATLTGAVLVALGTEITGVITNDDAAYEQLQAAAKRTGEKFWRLPNDKCFEKLIKGDFADFKNLGGRNAGTITAGMFIEAFVQEKPWMHLDIAGTSWRESGCELGPKGGTGAPVATLYELIAKPVCAHHHE